MGSSLVPRSLCAVALAVLTSMGACADLLGGDGYYIRPEEPEPLNSGGGGGGTPVAAPPEAGPDVDAEATGSQPMDGFVTSCMTAGDCPPPAEACRIAVCEAHLCGTMFSPAGSDCAANGGKRCNAEGECVSCRVDGILGDSESDVDCGGPDCPACGEHSRCGQASDCISQHCDNIVAGEGLCYPATCSDGLHNGYESDVDCGGIYCPDKCGQGKECALDEDCATGFCVDEVCCGVACEGPCKSCLPGTGACELSAADTDPGDLCPGALNNCTEDGVCEECADRTPNGQETGVDCGGSICPPCAAGGACVVPEDCASCVCVSGACEPPRCDDGQRDGCETDVDCGGPCGPTCAIGQACRIKADCALFNCVEGRCVE